METGVRRDIRRFVDAVAFAIIIVGFATAGSVMTPAGSTLPSSWTTVKTYTVDSAVHDPLRREGAQADPVSVPHFDDWQFFTRLASFLSCSRDWLAMVAGLFGYGHTSLSSVVTVADRCHPVPGLYALGRLIGETQ